MREDVIDSYVSIDSDVIIEDHFPELHKYLKKEGNELESEKEQLESLDPYIIDMNISTEDISIDIELVETDQRPTDTEYDETDSDAEYPEINFSDAGEIRDGREYDSLDVSQSREYENTEVIDRDIPDISSESNEFKLEMDSEDSTLRRYTFPDITDGYSIHTYDDIDTETDTSRDMDISENITIDIDTPDIDRYISDNSIMEQTTDISESGEIEDLEYIQDTDSDISIDSETEVSDGDEELVIHTTVGGVNRPYILSRRDQYSPGEHTGDEEISYDIRRNISTDSNEWDVQVDVDSIFDDMKRDQTILQSVSDTRSRSYDRSDSVSSEVNTEIASSSDRGSEQETGDDRMRRHVIVLNLIMTAFEHVRIIPRYDTMHRNQDRIEPLIQRASQEAYNELVGEVQRIVERV